MRIKKEPQSDLRPLKELGRVGFEPTKALASGFTDRSL